MPSVGRFVFLAALAGIGWAAPPGPSHVSRHASARPTRAMAVVCAVAGTNCGSVANLPARGTLGAFALDTTVDDEVARYYLERYLQGRADNPELDQRIGRLHTTLSTGVPSRDQLKGISKEFSVDFAALVFANQLLKQDGNPGLQEDFLASFDKVKTGSIQYRHKDTLVMFVPGYDYVENGHATGADFARPRKLLKDAGYDVHFVDIDPIGTVEENAEYLANAVRKNRGRSMVIAGASSAGPAIHLALGKVLKPSDVENVKAWLNLGGILQGVPILDKFASGPKGLFFSSIVMFKGWRHSSFESMYTPVSRQRFSTLSVPRHIAIYNYVGLSLSGNISAFGWDKYLMMREDGPNDGLTLLPDIIAPNSLSIISPTTDHFFAEDPDIDNKTMALVATLLERLDR